MPVATKTYAIIIEKDATGHRQPVGSIFYAKGSSVRAGTALSLYTDPGCKHRLGYSAKNGTDGTFVSLDKLKGSEDLKSAIEAQQAALDELQLIYETGEIPPTPEEIAKAEKLADAIKAVKSDDDTALATALLQLVREF